MRFISTFAHGVADYLMGIVLIAMPWALGFARDGAETWIPVLAGVAMIGLAMMTKYELGVVGIVPMSGHLMADAGMGILLAASPWLFGFANMVWIPFVVLGLGEIAASATTETKPSRRGHAMLG